MKINYIVNLKCEMNSFTIAYKYLTDPKEVPFLLLFDKLQV